MGVLHLYLTDRIFVRPDNMKKKPPLAYVMWVAGFSVEDSGPGAATMAVRRAMKKKNNRQEQEKQRQQQQSRVGTGVPISVSFDEDASTAAPSTIVSPISGGGLMQLARCTSL